MDLCRNRAGLRADSYNIYYKWSEYFWIMEQLSQDKAWLKWSRSGKLITAKPEQLATWLPDLTKYLGRQESVSQAGERNSIAHLLCCPGVIVLLVYIEIQVTGNLVHRSPESCASQFAVAFPTYTMAVAQKLQPHDVYFLLSHSASWVEWIINLSNLLLSYWLPTRNTCNMYSTMQYYFHRLAESFKTCTLWRQLP